MRKFSEEVSDGPKSRTTSVSEGAAPAAAAPREQSPSKKRGKKRRLNQNHLIRDTIAALGLCHNVTPVNVGDKKELQASSPDEVALVQFAEKVGYELMERDQNVIQVKNAVGHEECYDILAIFPFSSESKRMGIILEKKDCDLIVFYLKGAETVMEKKIHPAQRSCLIESCENLAM